MSQAVDRRTTLERYLVASERAAGQIIRAYSTSFGTATRLLGTRHRQHVRNVYALVRVADELVDGVCDEANVSSAQQRQCLDALEAETLGAVERGYSSNPIVHAFAHTARESGIDAALIAPFFASMRMDLRTPQFASATSDRSVIGFSAAQHDEYVFGSAEVVGLMCLRVFMRGERPTPADVDRLELGARSLGAAFQNVNFLRDLADDTDRLARSYLSAGEPFTEALKAQWIATIHRQLAEAEAALPLLPRDARVAVDCARRLFARLTDKLERTPAERLLTHRVRVANPTKVLLAACSVAAARGRVAT